MNDYQQTMAVNKTAGEVFTAITEQIPAWWSNDFLGAAAREGDRFNIAFGDTRKTFAIVKVVPDQQVIWRCEKAYIDMASLQNKAEWVGTQLIWTVDASGNGTTLSFLHAGLNNRFECYQVCAAGWNQFLASLEAYLNTGKGNPYIKKGILEEKHQAAVKA